MDDSAASIALVSEDVVAEEECEEIEFLFVERKFSEAQSAAERFFEKHFKKARGSGVGEPCGCVDLTQQPISGSDVFVARAAAVLLQCSFELKDPKICDFVMLVYRKAHRLMPYDLGLMWVRLQLFVGGDETLVREIVESSLESSLKFYGTPQFSYERYRSFLAILVHDIVHKSLLQKKGGEGKNEDEGEGEGIAESKAELSTIAEIIQQSKLSTMDKVRFEKEVEAESLWFEGASSTSGDANPTPKAEEEPSTETSTAQPASPQHAETDDTDGIHQESVIHSDAVAALAASNELAKGQVARRTWKEVFFFRDQPMPSGSALSAQFWLACVAQLVAWVRHLRARFGRAAQGLVLQAGIVILCIVFRHSLAKVLRRFVQELQT